MTRHLRSMATDIDERRGRPDDITPPPGTSPAASWPVKSLTNPDTREPIASSSLNFRWSKTDPETVPQRQRPRDKQDRDLARSAACSFLDANAERVLRRTESRPPAERAQSFLASDVLNFNPSPPARDDPGLRRRFEAHTRRGAPITVAYPLFAAIGNWGKRMYNDGLSMAEEVSILHFLNIDRWIRTFYPPGLRIVLLADARLYNRYLDNPEPIVSLFMRQLRGVVGDLDDRGVIELVDYNEVLVDHARAFSRHHAEAHRRIRADLAGACPGINVPATFQSLRASIYTKDRGMDYADHSRTFSADRDPANPHHRQLDERARGAYAEMMATREACRHLEPELFGSLWPDAIRVTCHVANDRAKPMIGLRPYPDYKRDSHWLMYHGVPALYRHNGRLRMAVVPEIRVRAIPELVRVIKDDGETYYYSGLEAGVRCDARSLSASEPGDRP